MRGWTQTMTALRALKLRESVAVPQDPRLEVVADQVASVVENTAAAQKLGKAGTEVPYQENTSV